MSTNHKNHIIQVYFINVMTHVIVMHGGSGQGTLGPITPEKGHLFLLVISSIKAHTNLLLDGV